MTSPSNFPPKIAVTQELFGSATELRQAAGRAGRRIGNDFETGKTGSLPKRAIKNEPQDILKRSPVNEQRLDIKA